MPSPLKRRKTFAECSTKYADALSAGAAPGSDCADESAGASAVSRIVVSATQAQRVLIHNSSRHGLETTKNTMVAKSTREYRFFVSVVAFGVVVTVTAPSRYFVAGAVLSGVRMFFSY